MRVVCIETSFSPVDKTIPDIEKGKIYTVVEIIEDKENEFETDSYIVTNPGGFYYVLAETGSENMYHESLFIKIEEDQQDEETFERNYKAETA
jgi:hypothetical protein